jgi:hypothetical protein
MWLPSLLGVCMPAAPQAAHESGDCNWDQVQEPSLLLSTELNLAARSEVQLGRGNQAVADVLGLAVVCIMVTLREA